ncbi:MAG: hypothetical protein ACK4K7_02250 [Allosphingosinicella sp.]|uniref:hypothetical protein n=1 Tax=Allosphingosinicella sp. TaxID=2823234 RepID=UPI00394FB169
MKRLLVAAAALAATVAAAMPSAAQLNVQRRADLAKAVVLEPGQGAILVGFRRPDAMSAGKSGALSFLRYDPVARDMVLQPRGARRAGDRATYTVTVTSADRRLDMDYALMIVSEGDYVLAGATPGPTKIVDNTFCLGAPTFRVNAGEIVYFGDVTPYLAVKLVDGSRTSAMAWSSHPDDARDALAGHPALAEAFRPAAIRNEATFACAGQTMLAYAVPGAPDLEDAPAPAAPAE